MVIYELIGFGMVAIALIVGVNAISNDYKRRKSTLAELAQLQDEVKSLRAKLYAPEPKEVNSADTAEATKKGRATKT